MYSLVLLAALSGAPDAPEFGGALLDRFRGGCCGSSSASAGGCSGYQAPRYSCYGGCSGSSFATGCSGYLAGSGCCGGDREGFFSRLRRFFNRGEGCCGGSGSGYGCFGSGYGCFGRGYGCSGLASYSCFGGPAHTFPSLAGPTVSYTPVFNGGLSCYGGGPLPAPPPVFDPSPAGPSVPGIMPPPPSIPYAPPEPAPATNPQNLGSRPPSPGPALVSNPAGPARATVVVRLPADARLFAEGKPLSLTGSERRFVTPELPPGQEFAYRFRVEYDRDGETVSVTRKVPVRAGGLVSVEFVDLLARASAGNNSAVSSSAVPLSGLSSSGVSSSGVSPPAVPPAESIPIVPSSAGSGAVSATTAARSVSTATGTTGGNGGNASRPTPVVPPAFLAGTERAERPVQPGQAGQPGQMERATLTVRLPAGAVLYVDDRRCPTSEPVRQFSTPPLPVGREFAYLMRVEVMRDGRKETFTQRVPFRGGERVEVDFTGWTR